MFAHHNTIAFEKGESMMVRHELEAGLPQRLADPCSNAKPIFQFPISHSMIGMSAICLVRTYSLWVLCLGVWWRLPMNSSVGGPGAFVGHAFSIWVICLGNNRRVKPRRMMGITYRMSQKVDNGVMDERLQWFVARPNIVTMSEIPDNCYHAKIKLLRVFRILEAMPSFKPLPW